MKKILFSGGPFDSEIWNHYRVNWEFPGRICGSSPVQENMIEGWLNARRPSVKPPSAKSITEITEEVINRLPNMDEENDALRNRSTVSFQQVDGCLITTAFAIRAHLKDCVSQVQNQLVGKIKGERNFTTRVKNGLYVKGNGVDKSGNDVVFIKKNGEKVGKPDGFQERTVRAQTPQGPISAIKNFGFVLNASVEFTVSLLGNSVKPEDLNLIMKYGATHGFGGERSAGEGRYIYTIQEASDVRKETAVA